jgi:hypothetical protein
MYRMLTALCLMTLCFAVRATDLADAAHQITRKEMKAEEYKKYVSDTKKKFETWSTDNGDGSMKRYLDDKLVEIAPGAMNGNVKALKKLVFWIALYKEFGEPAHSQVGEVSINYQEDIEGLLKDFSWEKAAAAIKERKKKHDQEQLALKK